MRLLFCLMIALMSQMSHAIALDYSNHECRSMGRLGPIKTFHIQIAHGIFTNEIVQVMYEGKYYDVKACIVDRRPHQVSFKCVPGTRVPLISVNCQEY